MTAEQPQPVPKIHPATREILPEDPLEMQAFEVPGDPQLMLRLLVEEYARLGWGTADIMRLAQDANYQAFHGLYCYFGEEELSRRVAETISRCGVMRVTSEEKPLDLPPENLVQIRDITKS